MLATNNTITYDITAESKEIDAVENIENSEYNMRRGRIRSNYAYNSALSDENCELRRKVDKLSNELHKIQYELESIKEKTGFIQRRENKTPLTLLLFIANDQTLSPYVYDILQQKLSLVTQCQMLLHKNMDYVNKELDKIHTLQQKDRDIIKSVINNYHAITDAMCYESKQEQFVFSIIWYSIECCGRIQDIVTTEYWKCVHYLIIYIYDIVTNFERYISRYIPLQLPGSIIDDICNKYNYIFRHKRPCDDQLRTLKDVIRYCSNNTVMNGSEKRFQKYVSQVADVTEHINDDDDIYDPLNDTEMDIEALKQQQEIEYGHDIDILMQNNEMNMNDIDVTHDHDDCSDTKSFVPDPNAKDFVPRIPLSSISEDDEIAEIKIETPSSILSSCTPEYYELGHSEYVAQSTVKYSSSKPQQMPQERKPVIKHAKCTSGHRSRSQVFISKHMISKVCSECIESFNTDTQNDEGLLFDYFKNSVTMGINDGQMNTIINITDKQPMVIFHIDLHFKFDGKVMYFIGRENDIDYRERVPWCVVDFMRCEDIYRIYGVNKEGLPLSSRNMKIFKYSLEQPPHNACLDIIHSTKWRKLPKKYTKRQNKKSFLRKTRLSESKLKFFCQRSWYTGPMVPVVVIKGKKQWIEWKKFIKIFDDNGEEQWVGFSLRYHRSNKQWKIECLEYDAGRIYYQHRLVGSTNHNYRYSFSYDQIAQYITTSLEIV